MPISIIQDSGGGGGAGDMTKAVYDPLSLVGSQENYVGANATALDYTTVTDVQTIFTVPAGYKFFPTSFITEVVTLAGADDFTGALNIGYTGGSDYDDFVSMFTPTVASASGEFTPQSTFLTAGPPVAAGTAIRGYVQTANSGFTTYDIKIHMWGLLLLA
jgi:hypothetical protein